MDARRMVSAHQLDSALFAVALDDGQRFRIDLVEDCPLEAGAGLDGLQILAPDAWLCPGSVGLVQRGEVRCPVRALAELDARDYAALGRLSAQRDVALLDPVEVRGARRHGFRGSPDFCFAPRFMRGWSEDRKGLLVEVSPMRSGGNRFYRVELAGSCPALASARRIELHSGPMNGLVCGNAGDHVRILPTPEGLGAGLFDHDAGLTSSIMDQVASLGTCPVVAVYPREEDRAR
ncbi:hypothetical protein ACFO3Q_05380 [Coralloluteibacterium thermophilus]|uniref:Uncharacterized protein n=2 Tax=Coralloluteibacterium thermophilum TaxID=2707049 RepID=A0ABV9NGV0_9GAMM